MTTQRLKVWPEAFDQLFMSGNRAWTIRRCDDRQFKIGEVIDFVRWDPTAGAVQEPAFCRARLVGITMHAGAAELLALADGKLVPMAVLTVLPMVGGPGEPPTE